jgi:ligand-binding sensor domain-containing protein
MRTRAALVLAIVAAAPAVSIAAPIVHSDTSDVRACAPLAGGGALVGTAGGLVHVDADGAPLATWTAADGLPGTRIEAIVPIDAGAGSYWLGADGGGARVTLAGGALAVDATIAARPLRDVVVHGGVTYAATWEGGVVTITGGRARAVAWKGKAPPARMRAAALAAQGGTLWAGTAAGLYALRGARLERVAIAGDRPEPAVTSLLADGERLWIATGAGLFVREADRARQVAAGDLRRVVALDGAVATAGIGDGVRVVDRGRLVALAGGPGLVIPQALAAGAGGAACAGGLDGLWLRASARAPWQPVAARAGVPSNDVSALAVDGARLWVGTFDRGLAVRERGGWRAVSHPDLDLRVNALLVEPRGDRARLWVGTAAGLMTLEDDSVARLTRRDGLPGRGVLSLARLRDGRVIAGTTTGAAIVGDGRAIAIGPPVVGNVWAVAEDDDGMLWLGTTTGVWRGPAAAAGKGAAADGWQRYSVATRHLHDDWVMAIAPRGRAVWVGSYKGGVVRFELPARAGAVATAPAALTATHVGDGWINPGGLAWDGDRLIASTQEGLRAGDGRGGRWTTVAGLPGKDVTAYLRAGATRWIATRRGLVEDR